MLQSDDDDECKLTEDQYRRKYTVRTNFIKQPVNTFIHKNTHTERFYCDEFRIESSQVHHRGQESARNTFIYIHC